MSVTGTFSKSPSGLKTGILTDFNVFNAELFTYPVAVSSVNAAPGAPLNSSKFKPVEMNSDLA